MSLISIVVVLIIVGVLLYVVNNMLPIDGNIKKLINIVVILICCLWVLQVLGVLGSLDVIRVR